MFNHKINISWLVQWNEVCVILYQRLRSMRHLSKAFCFLHYMKSNKFITGNQDWYSPICLSTFMKINCERQSYASEKNSALCTLSGTFALFYKPWGSLYHNTFEPACETQSAVNVPVASRATGAKRTVWK